MTNSQLVSTKEKDYLECDEPIRGQEFVCLSFITPDEIIKDKNVFMFNKFLGHFAEEMNLFMKGMIAKFPESKSLLELIHRNHDYVFDSKSLQEQYNFYKTENVVELEKEYGKQNDFQTSVYGVKVRGVYDSLDRAQKRAEELKKKDSRHNIWVGQVGSWLPFSAHPDEMGKEQEYAETHLNTLMKKYYENELDRNKFYDERKQELMNKIQEDNERIRLEAKQEYAEKK